ncbi:N-acetylmuramoyl-L-alanine amidase [Streptomyces sp. NPDC057235]|uniref:peptidoglycan recognition protein family protein n=1 Tax=Streptomyces sp. NPDC057235 TaxID=3346058 RepID=UPI00362861CD
MAAPITADQWVAALRAEGVTDIVEMPGWRTHNRNGVGAWGDVHATMVHHTAGEGSGLADWCYNGNSDLPGPLCHDFLARTGRLYLVGNGRANHAGKVARNAYEAVLNEQSVHPAPGPDELDGNAVSYGMECENSGEAGRDWPKAQYDVAVRVQAARCRFHGWSANSIWAHKESTTRKPLDPRIDMDQFRRDVAERLAHSASWNPTDSTPEEEDMTPEERKLLTDTAAAVKRIEAGMTVKPWTYKGKGETRDAYAHLLDIGRGVKGLSATGLTPAQSDALAKKVADIIAARLQA